MFVDKKEFFRFLVCEHSTGIKPSNFDCNGSSLLLLEGGPLPRNLRKLVGSYRRVSCGELQISLECRLFSFLRFLRVGSVVTA